MKFSKEELLAKGIDPTVADEIVASYDQSNDGTPLSKLEKALKPKKKTDEQSLFKAEKGEKKGDAEDDAEPDDDEDDEEKEKYMKKNQKACKKAEEEDKDEEEEEKEMKKAIDALDRSAPGAVVEMEDLTPTLSAIQKSMSSMFKAVSILSARIDKIVAQNDDSYDLMHKAAELQVETSKGLASVLSLPAGRKGIVATPMEKAHGVEAMTNQKLVYQVLAKAISMKDPIAGAIAERYESVGKNINMLSKEDRAGIAKLIQENNK